MARVTYVKSAKGRKDGRNRRCVKCGTEIKPGDSYKWLANRIGRSSQRKDFCANCQVRASDKTTSPHLQALYGAQEAAEDALAHGGDDLTLSDLAEIARGYGEAVREVGEGYAESADNIEEGFGHETYQSEEIREKAEECESAADTIDSAADDIEGLDDPDADESEFADEYEGSTFPNGKPTDDDDWADFIEEKRRDRRDAAIQAVEDALAEGPGL
jgi:hypothetical protein